MTKKRLTALLLATTIGVGALGGSFTSVHAFENSDSMISEVENEDSFNQNFSMSPVELKQYGLSDIEIQKFNNFISPGIYVQNGKILANKSDLNNGIQERGKFSAAVKIIRKVFNKLPPKVKNAILRYTALKPFLDTIEHYTGILEDAIYNACRKVGMPKDVANFVTKTIMLVF